MSWTRFRPLLITGVRVSLCIVLLAGCASPQPIRLQDWSAGTDTHWLQVEGFNLLVLEKPAAAKVQNAIHFYIEGDGTPWVKRFLVARNPTPRYPLALELMKRDPQLSFYLGRPCYYQSPDFYLRLVQSDSESPCDFHYWTDARYSFEVVELMKAAIEKTLQQLPEDKQALPLVVIGHSGGGTLAMLLAQRLEQITGVITIAANMDTEAWTKNQGYSPLKKSLNLSTQPQLRDIPQVHFAGSLDRVVPPQINQPLMQKLQRKLTVIDGFDHSCCWLNEWPALLQSAQLQLQQQAAAK